MPRFVLLHHEWPPESALASHWDLMLDAGDSLRTWSVTAWPPYGTGTEAIELPPHRLLYLDYEGPISGNRGHVRRCDRGTYELLHDSRDEVAARLLGQIHRGRLLLKRRDQDSWWLRFHAPEPDPTGRE